MKKRKCDCWLEVGKCWCSPIEVIEEQLFKAEGKIQVNIDKKDLK